jgi:hypothetical protein
MAACHSPSFSLDDLPPRAPRPPLHSHTLGPAQHRHPHPATRPLGPGPPAPRPPQPSTAMLPRPTLPNPAARPHHRPHPMRNELRPLARGQHHSNLDHGPRIKSRAAAAASTPLHPALSEAPQEGSESSATAPSRANGSGDTTENSSSNTATQGSQLQGQRARAHRRSNRPPTREDPGSPRQTEPAASPAQVARGFTRRRQRALRPTKPCARQPEHCRPR